MYEKRMIILTGERGEKGTLKAERHAGGLWAQINATTIAEGDYMLAVTDNETRRDYALGLLPGEAVISLDDEIKIDGVHYTVYRRDGEAVLYGTLLQKRLWWGNLPNGGLRSEKTTDTARENEITPTPFEFTKIEMDNGELGDSTTIEPTDIFPSFGRYADNAVATENYYEQKAEGIYATQPIADEKDEPYGKDENEEKLRGRKATFYESHEKEIERLIESNERVHALEKQLPDTRWVKVRFAQNRHYVVGVIGRTPDYICYGLPGIYSSSIPSSLKTGAVFLPIDPLRPQADGYWLLYQDAETGKTVT